MDPWNMSAGQQYNTVVQTVPVNIGGTTYNVGLNASGGVVSAVTPDGSQAINTATGQTFTPANLTGGLGGLGSNIMNSPIPLAVGGFLGAGALGAGAAPALTGTDAALADLAASAPAVTGGGAAAMGAIPAAADASLAAAAPAVTSTAPTLTGVDAAMADLAASAPAMTAATPAVDAGMIAASAPVASQVAAPAAATGSSALPAAAGAAATTAATNSGNSLFGGSGLGALGLAGAGLASSLLNRPSLPSSPDYKTAAEATAAAGRVNQITPYGSLTYAQTGVDAQGNPIYTQTTKLSDAQQKLLDQQNQTSLGLGQSINNSLGQVNAAIGKPLDASLLPANQINAGQTAQDAIMARLNPQFDRRQAALETQLANQGIARGTEAWNAAQTDLNNARNDAYTQAALQGMNFGQQARQQALQEQQTFRQEPINTLNALRTGAQVQNPSFGATPQGANYLGAAGQQYQANLGQYNAQAAQGAATTNGLFGLGAAYLGTNAGSNAMNKMFGG